MKFSGESFLFLFVVERESGLSTVLLQLGTLDTEVKVPCAENPELSKVLSFKPGVGQSIASHASPAARHSTLLIFTFLVHSLNFFFLQILPPLFYQH